jgi:hypothetical protein
MTADLSPEMRFEELLGEFSDIDGVTLPHGGSGFGRSALRYRGKIFAMFVRGALVVKLPGQRVDELIAAGHGARFDANKGTPMREWFTVAPDCPLPWPGLATEALDFARQAARAARKALRRPGRQHAHVGDRVRQPPHRGDAPLGELGRMPGEVAVHPD